MSESAVHSLLFRGREKLNASIQNVEQTQGIRLYSVTTIPLTAVLDQVSKVIPVPSQKVWQQTMLDPATPRGSTSNTQTNTPLTAKQWTALGIAAAAIIATGGGLYAVLKPAAPTPEPDNSASSVILSEGAQAPESNSSDAKRSAEPPTGGDLGTDNEGSTAAPRANKTPNNTPTAPSPNGSGPSKAAPAAKPASTQTPKKKTPKPPKETPASTPTPEAPPIAQQYPTLGSRLRFGSLGGRPLTKKKTTKSTTTLTLSAISNIASLDGAFTSAEQAAITKTVDGPSVGGKPTITIDGTKLNFTFKGNYCYADAK